MIFFNKKQNCVLAFYLLVLCIVIKRVFDLIIFMILFTLKIHTNDHRFNLKTVLKEKVFLRQMNKFFLPILLSTRHSQNSLNSEKLINNIKN